MLLITEASVTRVRLPNGLTVLIRPDHSAPVAAVVTYVRVGYFDEPDDVSGIAHVLEHMFFKGTPTRGVGEIARQTKASGGYLNAATIYDHTSYYAVLPAARFEEGLEIQADAYANSLIDTEELRRELEVIIEEAKRKADSPGAVTTESLFAQLHDRHRIRRWRIGREPGLRALSREQLSAFYRNYYRPSNTILVIVGDVTVERAMVQVEALYGSLPAGSVERTPGPVETARPGQRFHELAGDIRSTHFAFGWRTEGPLHPDAPALEMVATILGGGRASRLYRAVRNERLATSIHAFDYTPAEVGVFVVQAEGPQERTLEAARAAWCEIGALRERLHPGETARAKRVLESRWLRQLETMEGQASWLAAWEALGDWRLGNELAERTLALDDHAVVAAAAAYLDPGQASLLVYRPDSAPAFAADGDADAAFGQVRSSRNVLDATPGIPGAPKSNGKLTVPDVRLEHVDGDVSVFRTTRGLPILVRRRPGAPIAHFGFYVLGGSLREGRDESGLANLMARCTIKGTSRYSADQLALASELLGGSIGPFVTSDGMGWSMSVPVARHVDAVALLAEVVLAPTFSTEAVDTERAIAMSQLAQLRDDMHRYPVRLALEAAFGPHAYGRSILGDTVVLGRLGSDEIRAWHESNVKTGHAVVACVGDVEPDECAGLMARAFAGHVAGGLPAIAAPAWVAAPAQRVEEREKAQSAMAMVFPSAARRDSDRFAANVLATIASGLGGRFFEELRDRQSLAYSVGVAATDRLAAGHLTVYIATSPEKEDAARAGLLREIARLRDSAVTSTELENARAYLIGSHAIAQQSAGNVLAELVDAWLYGDGPGELSLIDTRIAAVTALEIQRFAQRYLDADLRVEGVVRGRSPR